jgi:DNA transformation protein
MTLDFLATLPADAALDTLPNIGAVLAGRLAAVGITDVGALRALGEDVAWARIVGTMPADACISSRLALAGAFRGVRWHALPADLRAKLSADVRGQGSRGRGRRGGAGRGRACIGGLEGRPRVTAIRSSGSRARRQERAAIRPSAGGHGRTGRARRDVG